jgi:hypothetical protein
MRKNDVIANRQPVEKPQIYSLHRGLSWEPGVHITDESAMDRYHLVSSRRNPVRMSAVHVRRDKAALFQWVQGPPGDSLQPEATGAGMEVTKCLKPRIAVTSLVTARVCRPQFELTRSKPRKGRCAGRPDIGVGEG